MSTYDELLTTLAALADKHRDSFDALLQYSHSRLYIRVAFQDGGTRKAVVITNPNPSIMFEFRDRLRNDGFAPKDVLYPAMIVEAVDSDKRRKAIAESEEQQRKAEHQDKRSELRASRRRWVVHMFLIALSPILGAVAGWIVSRASLGPRISGAEAGESNLRTVYDNLARITEHQNAALTKQIEGQNLENSSLRERLRSQQSEIETLRQQQAGFTQALEAAQTVGALKPTIIARRKEIVEAWNLIDDKRFYLGPDEPAETVLRQLEWISQDMVAASERYAERWKYIFVPEQKPNAKDPERMATLSERERRFNELLAAARALGMIEEMPQATRERFKLNLDVYPIRPIYRFAGEKEWWTAFQDLGVFPIIPASHPTSRP